MKEKEYKGNLKVGSIFLYNGVFQTVIVAFILFNSTFFHEAAYALPYHECPY